MSAVFRLTFSLTLLVSTLAAHAQEGDAAAKPPIPAELAGPAEVMQTFLARVNTAADEKTGGPLAWQKVYETLQIPAAAGDSRQRTALDLLGVLNALGRIDSATMLPEAKTADERMIQSFQILPEAESAGLRQLVEPLLQQLGSPPAAITLVKTDQGWQFDTKTCDAAGRLFAWVKPRLEQQGVAYGIDVQKVRMRGVRQWVPATLQDRYFLSLEYWQWIGLLALILLSVIIDLMARVMISPVLRRLCHKTLGEPDEDRLRFTARPMGLAVGAGAWLLLLNLLEVSGTTAAILLVAGKLVLVTGLTWAAWSLTDLASAVLARKAAATDNTIDDMIVPLLRKTIKLFIMAIGIIYVADSFGISLGPLLASFGLAGLAISFAAQDTIKNLFGGIAIFLDRPFKIGDRIKYSGFDGVIEEIGFRISRLRTLDGHVVTIPNGNITNSAIENVARRPYLKRVFSIGVTYDTPKEKLERAVEILQDILESDELRGPIHATINGDDYPPRVHFNNYGAFSLDIQVIYWFAPPAWWDFMDHAQKVNLRIFEAFTAEGLDFAFPSQTVYLAGDANRELAIRNLPG